MRRWTFPRLMTPGAFAKDHTRTQRESMTGKNDRNPTWRTVTRKVGAWCSSGRRGCFFEQVDERGDVEGFAEVGVEAVLEERVSASVVQVCGDSD